MLGNDKLTEYSSSTCPDAVSGLTRHVVCRFDRREKPCLAGVEVASQKPLPKDHRDSCRNDIYACNNSAREHSSRWQMDGVDSSSTCPDALSGMTGCTFWLYLRDTTWRYNPSFFCTGGVSCTCPPLRVANTTHHPPTYKIRNNHCRPRNAALPCFCF
jgi:hypothetical protein